MKFGISDSISRFSYVIRLKLLHAIYIEKNKMMEKNKSRSSKKSKTKYMQTSLKMQLNKNQIK